MRAPHKLSVQVVSHHDAMQEIVLLGDVLVPCDTPEKALSDYTLDELLDEVRSRAEAGDY